MNKNLCTFVNTKKVVTKFYKEKFWTWSPIKEEYHDEDRDYLIARFYSAKIRKCTAVDHLCHSAHLRQAVQILYQVKSQHYSL